MPSLSLKPTHKPVQNYYSTLAKFEKLGVRHEGAVRTAFHELLDHCASQFGWKLVHEYPIRRKGAFPLKADGALIDDYLLNHGLWEAKDSVDKLENEIMKKFADGYPKKTSSSKNHAAPSSTKTECGLKGRLQEFRFITRGPKGLSLAEWL